MFDIAASQAYLYLCMCLSYVCVSVCLDSRRKTQIAVTYPFHAFDCPNCQVDMAVSLKLEMRQHLNLLQYANEYAQRNICIYVKYTNIGKEKEGLTSKGEYINFCMNFILCTICVSLCVCVRFEATKCCDDCIKY